MSTEMLESIAHALHEITYELRNLNANLESIDMTIASELEQIKETLKHQNSNRDSISNE